MLPISKVVIHPKCFQILGTVWSYYLFEDIDHKFKFEKVTKFRAYYDSN